MLGEGSSIMGGFLSWSWKSKWWGEKVSWKKRKERISGCSNTDWTRSSWSFPVVMIRWFHNCKRKVLGTGERLEFTLALMLFKRFPYIRCDKPFPSAKYPTPVIHYIQIIVALLWLVVLYPSSMKEVAIVNADNGTVFPKLWWGKL